MGVSLGRTAVRTIAVRPSYSLRHKAGLGRELQNSQRFSSLSMKGFHCEGLEECGQHSHEDLASSCSQQAGLTCTPGPGLEGLAPWGPRRLLLPPYSFSPPAPLIPNDLILLLEYLTPRQVIPQLKPRKACNPPRYSEAAPMGERTQAGSVSWVHLHP